MDKDIEAKAVGGLDELFFCEKHGDTTLVFNTSYCPVCDVLHNKKEELNTLNQANKKLEEQLELAQYRLRDAEESLAKYKSDNADILALKKQVKDSIREQGL